MPKLPSKVQKAAEDATLSDFSAIPGGLYRVKVAEVDTTKKSAAGNPKWVFELEVLGGPNDLDDEKYKGRKLFDHPALTEAAAWKLKQIFSALGFTLDSDADELVGEECLVVVSQQEIETGNRAGQMGNNIDQWLSADEGGPEAGAAKGKKAGKATGTDDY